MTTIQQSPRPIGPNETVDLYLEADLLNWATLRAKRLNISLDEYVAGLIDKDQHE